MQISENKSYEVKGTTRSLIIYLRRCIKNLFEDHLPEDLPLGVVVALPDTPPLEARPAEDPPSEALLRPAGREELPPDLVVSSCEVEPGNDLPSEPVLSPPSVEAFCFLFL
jgi:hypothetical protein